MLKDNPLALSVIIMLLKLEVKVTEILNVVMCTTGNLNSLDWLQTWIKAQASLYSTDNSEAISSFKKLLGRPNFRDNSDLQVSLAEAYYFSGEYKKAMSTFKKVYASDNFCVRGMDSYAACLTKENQTKELELLANKVASATQLQPLTTSSKLHVSLFSCRSRVAVRWFRVAR